MIVLMEFLTIHHEINELNIVEPNLTGKSQKHIDLYVSEEIIQVKNTKCYCVVKYAPN